MDPPPEDHYVTMSICSPGPTTLPRKEARVTSCRPINDTSDIEGAHPQPKYKLFTNKPQFLNNDIPGATSKQLVRGRNVRDNSLYIDDIEGTRRTIKDRMMRTNRHVNPLEPHYPLASFVVSEIPELPFRRDTLNISDIDGTKPRPAKVFTPKDTMNIADIDGARPGLRETRKLSSMQTRDNLDVQDVCRRNHRHIDRTVRVTNPCAPVYHVNGMEVKDGKECRPRSLPAQSADSHLLMTNDIVGATPGSLNANSFVRREVRSTNFIGDISGAHADSIHHSITTNRQSNPLQPVYQSLDPGEYLLPLIPPLLPPEVTKIPTLPALNREKLAASGHGKPPKNPASSRGGSAGHGHYEGEYDPVLFTSAPQEAPAQKKTERLNFPVVSARSDWEAASARANSDRKTNFMQTTGQLMSQRDSKPPSNRLSGNNSGRNGAQYRQADLERSEDIAMVRQLQ